MVHSPLFSSHDLRLLKTAACTVIVLFLSLSTPGLWDPFRVFWPTAPPFHSISRLFHVLLIPAWLWTSSTTHLPCSLHVGIKTRQHIALPLRGHQQLPHSTSTSPAADWFPVPCWHCVLYTEARTFVKVKVKAWEASTRNFSFWIVEEPQQLVASYPLTPVLLRNNGVSSSSPPWCALHSLT